MAKTDDPLVLDPETQKNLDQWLKGHYDSSIKEKIQQQLRDNPKEIIDAFYTTLSFGTGGLRGIMGIGSNRMNEYTVRAATQGLANYLKKQCPSHCSVYIGYDSRHQSKDFAEETAKVLAGNQIEVFINKELRPTPLISFGCRVKKCAAAIMITASHNPPKYNGYKVYWDDGGQVLPPHDQGIIEEVNRITDVDMIRTTDLTHPLIHWVGEEIDELYLRATDVLQNFYQENHASGHILNIVYSSLHGAGITLVPKILQRWGFSEYHLVNAQKEPDGDFPTISAPNPEERSALKLGIDQLMETGGDLLIATDADADRMGVAVNHRGSVQLLTGNEIACICLEHLCSSLIKHHQMPTKAAFVKTIVTTELFKVICDAYHKPCFDVLTGFKYIAEQIKRWEEDPNGYTYIFGGEESYGYLYGTNTRDKDAVVASALLCEVALQCKLKGKTLIDMLFEMYKKYGIYRETLYSIKFEESKAGKESMDQAMVLLRKEPPKAIGILSVLSIEDYLSSEKTDLKSGKKESLTLPKSDVILFWLEDGSKLVVRPSGTEPKVKVYCGVVKKIFTSIEDSIIECDRLNKEIVETIKTRLKPSI